MGAPVSSKVDNCVKIIEEDENGQFILLEDGFSRVLANTRAHAEFPPVALLTFLGGATSDLVLFTDFFAKRAQGSEMWPETSERQNHRKTHVTPRQSCPQEQTKNGVYMWPKVIPLQHNSIKAMVVVLHVHFNGLMEEKRHDRLLELVKEISTGCVSIISAQKEHIPENSSFRVSGLLNSQRTNLGTHRHFYLDSDDVQCDKQKYLVSCTFLNTTTKIVQVLSNECYLNYTKLEEFIRLSINMINTNIQKDSQKPDLNFENNTSVFRTGHDLRTLRGDTVPPNSNLPKVAMNTGSIEGKKYQQNFHKNCKKLRTLYEEEMNHVLVLGKPICPDLLLKTHNSFLEEMCKILDFSSRDVSDRISFSQDIHEVFKRISAANLNQIGRLQNQVRGIIASYKSKYEIQMNALIQTAFSQNNKIEFCTEHDALFKTLKLQMTNELKNEFSCTEPVEVHIRTLEKCIMKSSKAFLNTIPSKILKQTKRENESPMHNMDDRASSLKTPAVLNNTIPVPADLIQADPAQEDPVPKNSVIGQELDDDSQRNMFIPSDTKTANPKTSEQHEDTADTQDVCKRLKPSPEADQHTSNQTMIQSQATKPTKLPCSKYALLLHLCATKIGTAIVKESSTYNEPAKLEETLYIPSKLIVTTNNKWFYGSFLTNDGEVKYEWDIGTFLVSNESINLKPEVTDLHFDPIKSHVLPLALFMSAVKLNAEIKRGIVVSRLMVAVPHWLSCLNRKLIIEAANLARFQVNQCHLINETASSAFHHFNNSLNKPYNAVIVSENSSKIDMSVYVYDETNNRIILCDHLSKAYKMVNGRCLVYDGNPDKRGTKSNQLEYYVNIQKALQRAEKEGHKINKASLALALPEKCSTEKVIENALLNDSSKPNVKIQNEFVLFGLSRLLSCFMEHDSASVDLFLRESFRSSISVVNRENKEVVSQTIEWEYETSNSIELPYKQDPFEYVFYQRISESNFRIGVLKLNEFAIPNPKPKNLDLVFSCDFNGIMSLRKILYKADKNKINELNGSRYTWSARNILPNQQYNERDLFDEIRAFNISALKLEKQREDALELGNGISRSIKNEQGNFMGANRGFERHLVQQQVDVSLKALMNGASDEQALKRNSDILLNIKKQYKL